MGNCRGKVEKPKEHPTKSYEEHCVTKHHLRMGVNIEKSPDGEIHVGFKGGLENKKDKVIKIDENEEKDVNSPNKIPPILNIISDEQ